MEILENPTLMEIAKRHNKSVAQIVLRWLVQQGIAIIPKTWELKHLKENINLFDFELNQEDMSTIDSMDRGKCLNYNPFAPHIMKCVPKRFR